MPVYKCPNKKYRIGTGKCMYMTRHDAESAYAAYRAISHSEVRVMYIKFVVEKLQELKQQENGEKNAISCGDK